MVKIDWNRRHYSSGRITEICRNKDCDWQMERNSKTGYDELEICPKCGTITDSRIDFGGLTVHYNRARDNFTLQSPDNFSIKTHIDCTDCPDALLFMIRHYRFNGWSEDFIRETQG